MKDQQLSRKKLKWFRVIAFSVPVLILLVTELVLRAFDYGHDTSLFIRYPDDPNYWVINKYASARYFSDTANATKGNIEPFKADKGNNSFRIFVLGESTTAGYPYLHNGSFHRWLQYRLMHMYPDINFEVINVSLTAVNSYTVLDFGKQVAKFKPDAVLIYTGHNEYYGALGVGSTSHIANNRFLVKFILALRGFRLVQLINNTISAFKTTGLPIDERDNLMKRMAADQKIGFNSAAYFAGIGQFKDNMSELCEFLQKEKIPTFLSTLVSNEKDLNPLLSTGNQPQTNANSQFALAGALLKAGNYPGAKQAFIRAKELDALRFRAPKAMNGAIIDLTKKYSYIHLVNARSVFEQASPHGILGNETLLEHVHPNLLGYALLSEAFYQSIQSAHLIKARPAETISFAELLKRMPVTKVDSLYGAYTIMMLKTRWPFNTPIPTAFKRGSTLNEQLAGALSVNHIRYLDAMNKLFQYSMQTNDKQTALKAVEAVMLENPRNITYLIYAGRLSFDLDNLTAAEFYFKKAYERDASPDNIKTMYLVYLKSDQPAKALPYINKVLDLQVNNPELKNLKAGVQEIMGLKNKLKASGNNPAIRQKIALIYHESGADEAAKQYLH